MRYFPSGGSIDLTYEVKDTHEFDVTEREDFREFDATITMRIKALRKKFSSWKTPNSEKIR